MGGEAAGQVAVASLKRVLLLLVEVDPSPGEGGIVGLSKFGEAGFVRGGAAALVAQVSDEAGAKMRVSQLFEQHGRQPQSEPNRSNAGAVVGGEPIEQREQRQIRFGGGLEQPGLAVRPDTVVQHVGKVPVQDQAEAAERCGHCFGSRSLCSSSGVLGQRNSVCRHRSYVRNHPHDDPLPAGEGIRGYIGART